MSKASERNSAGQRKSAFGRIILTPLFHICIHPFIVNEGDTVFDRPVTSVTPLPFSAAVYTRDRSLTEPSCVGVF
jgi:hypothetical protein